MTNIAINVLPEEKKRSVSNLLNDRSAAEYNSKTGFASCLWPGTITFDLDVRQKIYCIRFLLKEKSDGFIPKYKYRLLVSCDHSTWKVLYDCGDKGQSGWQGHLFPDGMEMRFIRIHALWYSDASEFQIMKIQVFGENKFQLPGDSYMLEKKYTDDNEYDFSSERGDGGPLAKHLYDTINNIAAEIRKYNVLNPTFFNELIDRLRKQARDVGEIENSMESIRREIIEPVRRDLELARSFGPYSKWGFVVGLIGSILAIGTLVSNIFFG